MLDAVGPEKVPASVNILVNADDVPFIEQNNHQLLRCKTSGT